MKKYSGYYKLMLGASVVCLFGMWIALLAELPTLGVIFAVWAFILGYAAWCAPTHEKYDIDWIDYEEFMQYSDVDVSYDYFVKNFGSLSKKYDKLRKAERL